MEGYQFNVGKIASLNRLPKKILRGKAQFQNQFAVSRKDKNSSSLSKSRLTSLVPRGFKEIHM